MIIISIYDIYLYHHNIKYIHHEYKKQNYEKKGI